MVNALQGYAFLKVAGKGQGLDDMRKMLSARFARSSAAGTLTGFDAHPDANSHAGLSCTVNA